MNGIHEFVIRGGQTVTAGQMDAFRRKLPFLKVKAEIMDEPELPHLKPQTNFLARYAEDVLDGAYPCSDLQAIAESFAGVERSFAVQAGREVRILVRPEEIDDLTASRLARDIVKKIEEQLTYPGQIKVTVIRETRAVEYAK